MGSKFFLHYYLLQWHSVNRVILFFQPSNQLKLEFVRTLRDELERRDRHVNQVVHIGIKEAGE